MTQNLTFDQRIEEQKKLSKRHSTISKYLTVALFFGPYLIFFIIFFIYPLLQGIIDSFFSFNFGEGTKEFVGWQNYEYIFSANEEYPLPNQYFADGLGHTTLFVVLTVPFLILIPLILALLLNKKPWGEGFFRALFFLPNVLSVSTVSLIFRFFFNSSYGFIKTLPFESEIVAAWIVLVLTTLWWTVGNNMVILNAGVKQVDQSLYEAASIDGCGEFRRIIHITLPQISNQILICSITTIIASFNVYGQAELITKGGPSEGTMMFIQRVLRLLNTPNIKSAGAVSAMCVLFALIILCLSLIQMYLTREKKDSHRRLFRKSHAYVKGA